MVHILHISDLQAGNTCLADRYARKESYKQSYGRYALKICADIKNELNLRPDMVVITGDVTEHGWPEEFCKAKYFIETLVDDLGIKWKNVLIVPGNHDVTWNKLKKHYLKKFGKKKFDPTTCSSMTIKMENFKKWLNKLYEGRGKGGYRYKMGEPIYFDNISYKKDIAFIGLDTCEGHTFRDKENQGHVSDSQLEKMTKLIKKYGENKFVIILMHHNPFPILEEPEQTGFRLKEAGKVTNLLMRMDTNLLLAGHMHRARYIVSHPIASKAGKKYFLDTLITGPCCMKFTGRDFYIDDKHEKEILPNRYQLLSLNPETGSCWIQFRKYSFEIEDSFSGSYGSWVCDSDVPYANPLGSGNLTLHLKQVKNRPTLWKKDFEDISKEFENGIKEEVKRV